MATYKYDIRWRLQFKSLNGTGCLVNIYTDDDTSAQIADVTKTGADVPFEVENGVIELTGTENPVYWEERNDKNLLDLVRYKTGYLNLIEFDEHTLEGLRPKTSFSRFITVYYGNALVFSGYLQCNDYSVNLDGFPRVAKIPIISPIGLLGSNKFTYPTAPGYVTIASVFSNILNTINPQGANEQDDTHYKRIIFPSLSNNSADVNAPFSGLLNPHMLCPLSSDNVYDSTDPESFVEEPATMLDFIKGFCSGYNYILHETPSAIIFCRLYYPNDITAIYRYIDTDSLSGEVLTGDVMNTIRVGWNSLNILHALSKMSVAQNGLKINIRQPKKAVITSVGGISTPSEIDTSFNLCKYQGSFSFGRTFENINPDISSAIWLPANKSFDDSDAYNVALATWTVDGVGSVPKPVVRIGQQARYYNVLTRKFYGLSVLDVSSLKLRVSFEYGTSINPADHNPGGRYFFTSDDLTNDIGFTFEFLVNDDPSTAMSYNLTTRKTEFYINGIEGLVTNGVDVLDTLAVKFKLLDTQEQHVHNDHYIRFTALSLETDRIPGPPISMGMVKKYREQYNTGGTSEATLSVPYSTFVNSFSSPKILFTYVRNFLTPYECMIPQKPATQSYVFPYMGHPQTFISGRMKHDGMDADDIIYYLYLYNWNLSDLLGDGSTGYNWRILSANTYPADDKMDIQWVLPDNDTTTL